MSLASTCGLDVKDTILPTALGYNLSRVSSEVEETGDAAAGRWGGGMRRWNARPPWRIGSVPQ